METNKALYLLMVDSVIGKYEREWDLSGATKYHRPENCPFCQKFCRKFYTANCPGCIFYYNGKEKCSDGFPEYEKLVDVSHKIMALNIFKREVPGELLIEFKILKNKRLEMYREILQILTGLPESRFDGKGLFPEVLALGNK